MDESRTSSQVVSRSAVFGRALVTFVPLVMLVVAMATLIFNAETRSNRIVLEDESEHIVDMQKRYIVADLASVVSDLALLSHCGEFADLFDNERPFDSDSISSVATEFLHFLAYRRMYDQVRFLDHAGQEIVRVNFNDGQPAIVPETGLQNKKHRYYFQDAVGLERDEVFVSPFDLNVEQGAIEQPLKPVIRFASPVFDRRGSKQGILLLNYLGKHLLDKFDNIGRMGHVKKSISLLLNSSGDYLRGARPEDEWGFMYEDRGDRTFSGSHPEAWKDIATGESGQFETGDGLFTFATVYPLLEGQISSTGSGEYNGSSTASLERSEYAWKIVSYLPAHALYERANHLRNLAIVIVSVLVMVLAAGSWRTAWSSIRRRRAEKEKERLIRDLREALAQVKTLSGFLPICASCKRIRDDTGYWNQIEAYIRDRSDAEFSHGICPDCAKKLYADYLE